MAAPIRYLFLRQIPRILMKRSAAKQCCGPKPTLAFRWSAVQQNSIGKWDVQSLISWTRSIFVRPTSGSKTSGRPADREGSAYHTGPPESDDGDDSQKAIKLVDFPTLLFPRPVKSVRNTFFAMMIRGYFDPTFSTNGFLLGAIQASVQVSNLISQGDFDSLDGLVVNEAVHEIRRNYEELSQKQRMDIAIDTEDITTKFVYEIGIIFDEKTERRFVEITIVLHVLKGLQSLYKEHLAEAREMAESDRGFFSGAKELFRSTVDAGSNPERQHYCNCRLIREYTAGKEDDWTINKFNYFNRDAITSE